MFVSFLAPNIVLASHVPYSRLQESAFEYIHIYNPRSRETIQDTKTVSDKTETCKIEVRGTKLPSQFKLLKI